MVIPESDVRSFQPFLIFFLAWIWPFVILDVVLKAIALWKSARNNQIIWFVILVLVNSLGILPAFYLFLSRKKAKEKTSK